MVQEVIRGTTSKEEKTFPNFSSNGSYACALRKESPKWCYAATGSNHDDRMFGYGRKSEFGCSDMSIYLLSMLKGVVWPRKIVILSRTSPKMFVLFDFEEVVSCDTKDGHILGG